MGGRWLARDDAWLGRRRRLQLSRRTHYHQGERVQYVHFVQSSRERNKAPGHAAAPPQTTRTLVSSRCGLGKPRRSGQSDQSPPRWNPRLELHDPHRWLELEARLPRPARVHHRHRAVHQLEQGLVGVAVHDDLGARKGVMQFGESWMSELVAVRHHDREPVELELGDLRQASAQLRRIRVAVHCGDGCDSLELDQDLRRPDVAGVEDVVDLLEHLEHFRPQQAVSVRNNTQSHGAPLQRTVVASYNYFPSQRFTTSMSSPRWSSTRCTTKSTMSRTSCG